MFDMKLIFNTYRRKRNVTSIDRITRWKKNTYMNIYMYTYIYIDQMQYNLSFFIYHQQTWKPCLFKRKVPLVHIFIRYVCACPSVLVSIVQKQKNLSHVYDFLSLVSLIMFLFDRKHMANFLLLLDLHHISDIYIYKINSLILS